MSTRKYAEITVAREAKRRRSWRRGWDRARMVAVAETVAEDREHMDGEDYRGGLSNPDSELSPLYGYNYLEAMDELDRPGHWGVAA